MARTRKSASETRHPQRCSPGHRPEHCGRRRKLKQTLRIPLAAVELVPEPNKIATAPQKPRGLTVVFEGPATSHPRGGLKPRNCFATGAPTCGAGGFGHQRKRPAPGLPAAQRVGETNTSKPIHSTIKSQLRRPSSYRRSSPRYPPVRGYWPPPMVLQSRRDECTIDALLLAEGLAMDPYAMDVADCYDSVNRRITGPCRKQLHPCACNRN